MKPTTMHVPMFLLLSVAPGISCMFYNVTRLQDTQKYDQASTNVTRNVLFWLPNSRHTRHSSEVTSRQAGTISSLQTIDTSTDRNKPTISDTQQTKHQDGSNINTITAALLPAGGESTTQITDLTALDLSQNEHFLNLTKREHTTQIEENKEFASSVLSSLFFNSRIDLKFGAKNKVQSARPCMCENLTCDCSGRLLTSVPQNLPVDITTLLLDRNHLKSLPKNAFSRYKHLNVLDLSVNHITVTEQGTFFGLDQLTWLDLSRNSIGKNELPHEDLFEPLRSLKFLRFDLNQFPCNKNSAFYGELFSRLQRLEELEIDSHGEQYYDIGFKSLRFLRSLKVHAPYCSVDAIYNSTFENLQQLQILNISDCRIEGANIEYGAFSFLTNLQTLDISRNPHLGLEHLPRVMYGMRNSSLETLIANTIVDKYSLNFVNTSTIQYLPQTLTTLIATGNNIVYIDPQVIQSLPKSLKTIDISDNDITMDPKTIPLADIQELQTLVINNINEECPTSGEETFTRSLRDRFEFLMQTKRKNKRTTTPGLTATKNTILPLKLTRVEMSIKDMDYQYIESINENNSVKELDLGCSYLPIVEMDSFAHLPKLSYLNLRSSFIRLIIPPDSNLTSLRTLILESNYIDYSTYQIGPNFENLTNLIDLDVSNNDMTVLTEDLFGGIDKLEYLRLSGNVFSDFIANISHLQHLKLLNLSNTGLPFLPEHVRAHINKLSTAKPGGIRVDMSGCPIQCDCFNLKFLKWMTSSPAFDNNFSGYKCRYPDTSVKYIEDRYEETLHQLTRECAQNYPMYLIILAGTLMVFSLVIGMVIYRFRWKIRYLYYAAYLSIDKNRKDNNHPFAWDVFMSYDAEDRRFVEGRLIVELQQRGLELLVDKRDFLAGQGIMSNIIRAVAESRKTLVVLTRNLLESRWCNYEIQMAAMEGVHKDRPVLVFLLMEDIPNRELDLEILRHIQSNTYLPYPGPEQEGDEEIMTLFYDRLAHDLLW